jgi:hypothetical protein
MGSGGVGDWLVEEEEAGTVEEAGAVEDRLVGEEEVTGLVPKVVFNTEIAFGSGE